MISITNRPAGVNEWTVPINALKDASIDERMEFYRAHPDIVAEAREKHPDAFPRLSTSTVKSLLTSS